MENQLTDPAQAVRAGSGKKYKHMLQGELIGNTDRDALAGRRISKRGLAARRLRRPEIVRRGREIDEF